MSLTVGWLSTVSWPLLQLLISAERASGTISTPAMTNALWGGHVGVRGELCEAILEFQVQENPASLAFVPWKPNNNTHIWLCCSILTCCE